MSQPKGTDAELAALKAKLSKFENQLQELVTGAREDLEIARQLQKVLMPNRLPQIQGLKCFARYISAGQISSEGFDIIPTQKGRETWFVASWTERFGLSSVLLQALVHLQSQALVDAHPEVSPAQVFNDLSISLTEAKRGGKYRLLVARLDSLTLKVSGVSIGSPPFLRRTLDRNHYGVWESVQAEPLSNFPELMDVASSEAPVTAERAHNFNFQLSPGSRLYYLSGAWAEAQSPQEFTAPLELEKQSQVESTELLDDINHLIMRAEDYLKAQNREADITALGFEVDPRKLHLA